MVMRADGAVEAAGADATAGGSVPIAIAGSFTVSAVGSGASTYWGTLAGSARTGAGLPLMRKAIRPYATTNPATPPSRALLSPGSVVGGASFDWSQPHCLHSFASGSIGSPQKLQCFVTLVPRAPIEHAGR